MLIKFIKALLDWTFMPHGYISKFATASEVNRMSLLFKSSPKTYKCKYCGNRYMAVKRNDTCRNIKCFIGYRLRRA